MGEPELVEGNKWNMQKSRFLVFLMIQEARYSEIAWSLEKND